MSQHHEGYQMKPRPLGCCRQLPQASSTSNSAPHSAGSARQLGRQAPRITTLLDQMIGAIANELPRRAAHRDLNHLNQHTERIQKEQRQADY